GTPAAIQHALKARWGLVVGTTGLDAAAQASLRVAAKSIPVVHSSNMSVGVNLMLELASLASRGFGKDFDIEVTEAHHRHKKDAPSGTALMLAAAIAWSKGWDLKKVMRFRQAGKSASERPAEEIGMQVIRAGEIVGDHTVLFAGPSETLEITHRAHSRDAFARGALTAAAFASKKARGLYTMSDVLK
ncbi:MAG TPA: 4-hydroxy-tetrahydrodipicolinate reductase, partial [Candidatus Eisenbacteria bacterium]|nr:4-hydroxy-tetrahydrodipicolinate reductase [Candidatus Eisenbacteria bacterium]